MLDTFNLCPSDPDNDYDNDTVCGDVDNCPYKANPGQEDNYPPLGNSCGNVCECEGNFNKMWMWMAVMQQLSKRISAAVALNRPCTNR